MQEYKLVAFISHIGSSIQNGHYVTQQIVNKQKMVTYDDCVITEKKYNYEKAYILGYSKIDYL